MELYTEIGMLHDGDAELLIGLLKEENVNCLIREPRDLKILFSAQAKLNEAAVNAFCCTLLHYHRALEKEVESFIYRGRLLLTPTTSFDPFALARVRINILVVDVDRWVRTTIKIAERKIIISDLGLQNHTLCSDIAITIVQWLRAQWQLNDKDCLRSLPPLEPSWTEKRHAVCFKEENWTYELEAPEQWHLSPEV
jgi:hypothetical protein